MTDGMTLAQERKWDGRFIEMAKLVAGWSRDPSTKVGAVLVKNKRVISLGFNGFPAKMSDDEALYENREEKYSRVVHAEINSLIFAARPLDGATLYTTPIAPCDRCAVQMLQAGVVRFVFPKLPANLEERWGVSVARTKKYIEEMGAIWAEVGGA